MTPNCTFLVKKNPYSKVSISFYVQKLNLLKIIEKNI